MDLETVSVEEQLLLNILLDDESFSSGESHSSLKRKANNDLNEDTIKQRRKERKLKKQKSRWRRESKSCSQSSENSPRKKMIVRPNYFVGIQVSNPEIHRLVKKVQEKVLSIEPSLRTAAISIPTLHVTLAVAHLPDIEHVNKAAELLERCTAEHKDFFNTSVSLHFSGLKTFGSEVLFASVQQSEVLDKVHIMAADLENAFEELTGTPAKRGFKPHLTIFKISKDYKLRKKGNSKISSNVYSNMVNTVFGTQEIRGLQLLSMNKPKDENGYYYCSHRVTFDTASSESDDHSECCKTPLAVNSNLQNVSQIQETLKQEKDMVKRRFHSLSLSNLNSVFKRREESEDQSYSTLKTLLVVSAATVALIAAVRGFCSSK